MWRLLLINKRDRVFELAVPGGQGARLDIVDQSTAFNPPASSVLANEKLSLSGLAVAVVTFTK